jgi:hypothetical protein
VISISASLLSMSPLDAEICPNHPFLTRRHFPSLVLLHMEKVQILVMVIARSEARNPGTYQHAVVAVLVQQQHACLEAHSDLLLGGAPVVRVEDGFAADAG